MKISHSRAVELLPLLVSGALRGAARQEVEAHAQQCSSCREWLETYTLLWRGLGGHQAAEHVESTELALFAVRPQEIDEPGMESARVHLASCGACRHELELVATAIGGARRGDLTPESMRTTFAPRRQSLFLAAGIAVAILAAAAFWKGPLEKHRRSDAAPGAAAAAPATQLVQTSLEGARVFEVEGRLEVARVDVAGGADITFRAGERVVLGDGFRVGPKAKLAVEVGATSRGRAVSRGSAGDE